MFMAPSSTDAPMLRHTLVLALVVVQLGCGGEGLPMLDAGSGGGASSSGGGASSSGGGSGGGSTAGGSAVGGGGGAGGGTSSTGGGTTSSGGGTTQQPLDSGCYLLTAGLFEAAFANEGVTASLGIGNDLLLRFDPRYRQNFVNDAGPKTLDAGSYDVSSSALPFTLTASMNNGPLGGPVPVGYRAIAGTVVLDQVTTPPSSEARGRLDGITFRELDGGRCGQLTNVAFNTLVPAGTPCSFGSECGDTFTKSCQPSTQTCQPRGCDGNAVIVDGQLCLPQTGGTTALYRQCDAGCQTNETCIPYYDPAAGLAYCKAFGSAAEGQSCAALTTDVNTGCVAGLSCEYTPGSLNRSCTRLCNRLAAMPGCASSQRCYISTCVAASAAPGDPAAIGQNCASAQVAKVCGDDGLAYRGTCVFLGPDGGQATPAPGTSVVRKCRTACSTQAQCGAGQQCVDGTCG